MKVYLAGGESRPYVLDEYMKLYLAGENIHHKYCSEQIKENNPYILESFFYADETVEKAIPLYGDFLLDSGAFTFMQHANGRSVDWEQYIERYADFIRRNCVDKFFELDIDSIVGYGRTLEFRKMLEEACGKRCIPVWHKSRGKHEFLKMCDEYDYVALGGIVSKEWSRDEYKFFPWFIREAHKRNTKIHGLGFTQLGLLEKYHFDSVDSTAWTTGNRYGYLYRFNGRTVEQVKPAKGKKLADTRQAAVNNFLAWVQFQKYAINNL